MAYKNFTRKKGAVSASAGDPMKWDLSGPERDKAVLVFNAVSNQADTLIVRQAETELERDGTSVQGSLFHDTAVPLAANTDKPVVVTFNPALPYGKAWLTGTGTNYILSGCARAHS